MLIIFLNFSMELTHIKKRKGKKKGKEQFELLTY